MGVREERLSVVCLEIIGGGLFQEINSGRRRTRQSGVAYFRATVLVAFFRQLMQ